MAARVFTAEERPDLWDRVAQSFRGLWPEYNHHGQFAGQYFSALVPRFACFQILLCDATTDEVVARGRSIPFRWDLTEEDLPRGIDAVGLRALEEDSRPTALSALSAEVVKGRQGEGLSGVLIKTMAERARAHGLSSLVAPVRPILKDRYPITPIEGYASWCRGDGLPFDPWIRLHARLGAEIVRPEPRSMFIRGSVTDWERWTGMSFPAEGRYVFSGGLAPLEVTAGIGEYYEPNVWMRHEV